MTNDTTEWVSLSLTFARDERSRQFVLTGASELEALVRTSWPISLSVVRARREEMIRAAKEELGPVYQPVCLAISLLCDLIGQGWDIRVAGESIQIKRPDIHDDRQAEKDRVRRALLIARDEQLSEPPVRAFIKQLETRRLGPRGWCSIFSLMRDGKPLAEELRQAASIPFPERRLEHLRQSIKPYLQFVTETARCEWTGLSLSDIWRYFRFTWSAPIRTTPGRTMMVLIRDAAVEPHPVIGIAALSSSIVQLSERDRWIGWDGQTALAAIKEHATDQLAAWLLRSLEELIAGIAVADLFQEGVLTAQALQQPDDGIIIRLRELGLQEKQKHQRQSRTAAYKRQQDSDDWATLVRLPLYRSKRALTLADLLSIRKRFAEAGFSSPSSECLRSATSRSAFREAVARLVRYTKASRVGINMMDLSTLGAIAPYNILLGGKLVSLLMASPEVREEYARRYGQTPSVIASAMKGEPVIRKPDLVLLCTTGLFAAGTSQYNRICMPASKAGGTHGEIRYIRLNELTAYGTFHISQETMNELKIYSEQWHEGSDVHGIFGEGVNPKMRKIREGLYRLGFPQDELLRHGAPRAVYVIPLAHNFREILLGRSDTPDYILSSNSSNHPSEVTQRIVDFWYERWLSGRIERPGVLEAVSRHTTTYPLLHGARVPLPELEEEGQLAFEDMTYEPEMEEYLPDE